MADKKIKVSVDVDSNLEPTIANLKELKKQLKQTAAGSDEFKKIFNQIDDLEDKIKSAKGASSDWIDTLESAGGPIGMLGGALNKAKVATISFGAALKAAGIGLIVAAVGGLVAAFSNVEGATKKLEPLLIGFEKILGGIFEALTPLIDGFVELATKALPYITTGIKVFYSSLVALFTLVKEAGVGVGKILKGVFTLDMTSIKEGWDQLKGGWSKTVESYNATSERFEAGTKKLTKTEKENQKERNDNAQKAFDEKLKRLEAEDKLDEARLKKLKEETLALATTEQEKLDIEKKFAELAYKLRLKDLDDKMALYSKDSVEYKNLQTEKTNAEAEYVSTLSGFKDKQKEITDKANKDTFDAEKIALDIKKAQGLEEATYQQQLYDLRVKFATDAKELAQAELDFENYKKEQRKKGLEEERGIALLEIQGKIEELDRKNQLAELDFEQDLERLKVKRELLTQAEATELQNTELTEFQRTEIRKKYADQRAAITTSEIQTEKAAMEAKHAINSAYLDLFAQFGNTLTQLAGKNKAIAIAGIVISQAAAIGQIIANTGLANAKAVAASPVTFGQPWVAINTISAGLSIASTIASAAKSIQQINSAASQAGVSGGGGGGAVSSAPQIAPPRVGSTAAPEIQTGQGINATAQIGQTIAGAQKPIRAYVVSGEVSSQQALDRRTSRAATFTGG